jgi:hypothetical protein
VAPYVLKKVCPIDNWGVADFFDKRHDNVLQAIDTLIATKPVLRHREFTPARYGADPFLKCQDCKINGLAPFDGHLPPDLGIMVKNQRPLQAKTVPA